MRLMAHLWTGAPAPPEYIEYLLCCKFHKLPSEIRRESLADMLRMLTCMSVEAKRKKSKR